MPARVSTVVRISTDWAKACVTIGVSLADYLRRTGSKWRLLVAQCLNGVQVRRLPRRINAEYETDSAGDRKGDYDPGKGKGGVQKRHRKMKNQREQSTRQNADEAADHAKCDGFKRELQKNI